MSKAAFSSDSYAPDGLVVDGVPLKTLPITLNSGQNLTRGAVLGKITSGGNYTLSLSAAGDGSQTPDLILAEDADATSGDVAAIAYERGDFDQNKLTIGTGHDADSIREGLRVKGIYLHNSQTA